MHRASGIGTYIRNIVPYLTDKFEITLLVNPREIEVYSFLKKVNIIKCTSRIYTIEEQLELFRKIPSCDIFWSPHYNIPLLPIRAKKKIVTIHDVFHLAFYHQLNWKQKIYARFVIIQAVKRSDVILTVSNFSANEIKKYTKTQKDIKVVYNGLDFERFRVINNKEVLGKIKNKYQLPDDFILFVGNVKPHKNLKNLLIAIKNLNVNLVIVGKKEGFITGDREIYNIINNNNLGSKVFFTGHVDDEDLPKIYNLAKIFIFPSFYEGFGLPPIEAMACGCPVVCSKVASLPEVCGDAAYYVDPYNIEDIARGIDVVIKDESLRQSLIRKGFENVKRFSWEKSAQQIVEIIYKLL